MTTFAVAGLLADDGGRVQNARRVGGFTLSDPLVWENTPGGIVATPLTVVALLMTPTGLVVAVTFVTAFPDAVVRVAPVKNDPCGRGLYACQRGVECRRHCRHCGARLPMTPFTTLVDVVPRLMPRNCISGDQRYGWVSRPSNCGNRTCLKNSRVAGEPAYRRACD